jgi:hypothetical protein
MHTGHVEQEQELPVEQAQVEDVTNTFPEQGKPWCITNNDSCIFFKSLLYVLV